MADKEKKRDEITETLLQQQMPPQESILERLAKGFSSTFLSTPYPTQERPIDPAAWSRAVQEQGDSDEEMRRKRGYGFPR